MTALTEIAGDNGDNTLTGDEGDNLILGLGGDDTLFGLGGNDILVGGYGANILTGGAGNDTFWIDHRGTFSDTITDFTQYKDLIDVSIFNVADFETLLPYIRQDGDDIIIETFWDHSSFAANEFNEFIIIENMSLNDLTADDFRFYNINTDIIFDTNSNTDFVLFGGNGNDELTSRNGNDELNGGNGDDILTGGFGSNLLRGGHGADAFIMDARGQQTQRIVDFSHTDGDRIDVSALNVADLDTLMPYMHQVGDDVHIKTFWDWFTFAPDGTNEYIIIEGVDLNSLTASDFQFNEAIENIIFDTINGGDFVLFGGVGDDVLISHGGRDELNGGAGDDILDGGKMEDILRGGTGDDLLIGGDGNDTLEGGNGRDTMRGGDGRDTLYGGADTDFLLGGDARDRMFGGDQSDRMFGQDGNDIMVGGRNNDIMYGGGGADKIYGGQGNDNINGGSNVDYLFGQDNSDKIYGGNAGDFIDGGSGNDMLFGGDRGGADGFGDTFIFANNFGTDVIGDFEDGLDVIDFSGHTGINDFNDVLARASEDGTSLLIATNANNTLIIENFSLAELDASDFVF